MINDLKDDILEDLNSWGNVVEDVINHRRKGADRDEFRRILDVLRAAQKSLEYRRENLSQLTLPFSERVA
jgi:hypothetical protein